MGELNSINQKMRSRPGRCKVDRHFSWSAVRVSVRALEKPGLRIRHFGDRKSEPEIIGNQLCTYLHLFYITCTNTKNWKS